MKDRVFLDTNVFVYAKLETEDDREKRDMAIALIHQLKDRPVVSIQVLNELSSVLIRHSVSNHIIREAIQAIIEDSIVIPLDIALVWQTWTMSQIPHFDKNRKFVLAWYSLLRKRYRL